MTITDSYKILDGSTGIYLRTYGGLPSDVFAEQWILDHPSSLQELQRGYIEAGSDIIMAPTFGAHYNELSKHGQASRLQEINRDLVALSRFTADNAASEGKTVDVFADISSMGMMPAPYGDSTFEEIYKLYLLQTTAIADVVDGWSVETMTSLTEARAAVMAIRAVSDRPLFVTFSADSLYTVHGVNICSAAVCMQRLGADAFGINCFAHSHNTAEIYKQLTGVTKLPLIAKPNAGLPKFSVERGSYYDTLPDVFADSITVLYKYNVRYFGGCCGTTPEYIAALSSSLSDILPGNAMTNHHGDGQYLASERVCRRYGDCLTRVESVTARELPDVEPDDISLLKIIFECESDIDRFEENQYMLSLTPICLCGNMQLVQAAERLYNGVAHIEIM